MFQKFTLRSWVSLAVIAFVALMIFADHAGRIAAEGYTPTPVGSPVGTPTLPTPVTEIPEDTAQPTVVVDDVLIAELPSTGAGTTAREVKASNHYSGRHYISTICYAGWWQNKYGSVSYVYSNGTHLYSSTWLEYTNYRCY